MNNGYVNKMGLDGSGFSVGGGRALSGGISHQAFFKPAIEGPSFKDVMFGTMGNLNNTVQAPDALMHSAMTTGEADVHDVMIANAKAELAVNVTAQFVTKVVQAYDRILQIQV